MSFLYLTADTVGTPTGGGIVTHHESETLRTLSNGQITVWGKEQLDNNTGPEPWKYDECACIKIDFYGIKPKLCHIYAGTFSNTVRKLKALGCKTVITCAAHSREVSQREHEKLGIPFPYTHLTDPELWKQYSQGYNECDVLVCPSLKAAEICKSYGRTGRIEIIPHGCDIPEKVSPLPSHFTVGYLGSFGCDKGIRYLLEAWKRLNYKDATLLLGGKDSTSPFASHLIERFGGGNIQLMGWVDKVSDFYNKISLYIQPSATEGMGIEVLESMAHGRMSLVSTGVGAADCVPLSWKFSPCDSDELAKAIDRLRTQTSDMLVRCGDWAKEEAKKYTWSSVRQQYIKLWKELL